MTISQAIRFDLYQLVTSEEMSEQYQGFRGLLELFGYTGNVSFSEHSEGGIIVSVGEDTPLIRFAVMQLAAYLQELNGTRVWLQAPDN